MFDIISSLQFRQSNINLENKLLMKTTNNLKSQINYNKIVELSKRICTALENLEDLDPVMDNIGAAKYVLLF